MTKRSPKREKPGPWVEVGIGIYQRKIGQGAVEEEIRESELPPEAIEKIKECAVDLRRAGASSKGNFSSVDSSVWKSAEKNEKWWENLGKPAVGPHLDERVDQRLEKVVERLEKHAQEQTKAPSPAQPKSNQELEELPDRRKEGWSDYVFTVDQLSHVCGIKKPEWKNVKALLRTSVDRTKERGPCAVDYNSQLLRSKWVTELKEMEAQYETRERRHPPMKSVP